MQPLLLVRLAGLGLLMALLPTFTFAQIYNYFAGPYAGVSNTTGSYNSFVGYQAGYRNTTGSANTFLGLNAGLSNTTGNRNSFVGYQAGLSNTTGFGNSFLGYEAGRSNTTGYQNSFLGPYAGYSNTTGYYNSFLGKSAGYANSTGFQNSFVGTDAGFYNTTGSYNSFLGRSAGLNNTTGSYNSIVGYNAGSYNTTGHDNSFLGIEAGIKNSTGSFNVSLGNYSGPSQANLSNAIALGYRASVSVSNALVLGSVKGVNWATASTKVGIGTSAPAYELHVNGTAAKPGGGSWIVASDQRLKKDIATFSDGLEVVKKIKPVWFNYNGQAGMPQDKRYVGVIAQEMQQIAPYTIGKFNYQDSTGKATEYLDYDANALTYILVNSVQQVDEKYARQLEEQQKQLEEKDEQIAELKDQLSALEQKMTTELAALKALLLQQPPVANAEGEGAARLWQNEPNPTDGSTVIRYRIPLQATSARIQVYTTTGQPLQSFDLTERGEGSLTVSAGQLPAGTYIYHLLVDGKSVGAKKLVLQK